MSLAATDDKTATNGILKQAQAARVCLPFT